MCFFAFKRPPSHATWSQAMGSMGGATERLEKQLDTVTTREAAVLVRPTEEQLPTQTRAEIERALTGMDRTRFRFDVTVDDTGYGWAIVKCAVLGDVAAAMSEAAEVVQEYARLYDAHTKLATAASAGGSQAPDAQPTALDAGADQGGGRVDHVLYELMTERDKLGELSKLVGTMRFATERDDRSLVAETDESIEALERLLPERYWTAKVRAAAKDTSENGAKLAQLYVERCYKLLDDDFAAVQLLEKRIGDFL